jgi:large subunit ribosomal protein L4
MKVQVKNTAGANTEVEVSDAVFAARFNEPLVHQVVVAYRANGRQGTRKQKTRSEVRGGGRAVPSSPDENFGQKVNRKQYRAALRSILSELVRDGRLLAVEDFRVEQPKTRAMVAKLKELGVDDALIVTEAIDDNLALAARNLHRVGLSTVSAADPVSLLAYERVIMTTGAIKRFEAWLA